MKAKALITAALISLGSAAQAAPGFYAGITYLFDDRDRGSLGFTIKALATRHDDRPAAAIGFSVYPSSPSRYGIDIGVGYQKNDAAALLSYDLLLERFSLSLGYADLHDK